MPAEIHLPPGGFRRVAVSIAAEFGIAMPELLYSWSMTRLPVIGGRTGKFALSLGMSAGTTVCGWLLVFSTVSWAMFLSSLTSIGFCANMMLDRREQAPFSIDDLYVAVDRGELVDLLLRIDDSGAIELWAKHPEDRAEVERALGNAAEAMRGQEIRKTGVGENALCLVVAFVLEAIQQNFRR